VLPPTNFANQVMLWNDP